MKIVLLEATAERYRLNPMSQMARVLEPLAIESIGAYLNRSGHEVHLIHQLNQSNEDVVEEICRVSPGMVGISCMTYSFPDAQTIACAVKKRLPSTRIVLGGYHVLGLSSCPTGFDFIVRGEGEHPCRDIAEFLEGKLTNPASIPGLHAYRDPASGRSVQLHSAPWKSSTLHTLPLPIRLPRDNYYSMSMGENMEGTRLACVVIGRGCPFNCDFCCTPLIFRGRHDFREFDQVVEEIQMLQEQHGVNTLNLRDETFGPESTVRKFCHSIINSGLQIKWRAFATIGTLTHDTLTLMAEAGCHMLFYGIEASDTTTLRLRRKSFAKGFEKIASDIHHAQSCGIFVRGGFIVGHETDTEETFVRHLEFLKEVRPDELYLSFLTPFPGTPLYAKAEKQGLLLERDWRKYDCEHPVMKVRIPAPELVRLRRDLYQQYYNSSEWNSHLDSRIARREQERDTIGIYRNFIDGRLKLMKNNLFFNGS